MEQGITTNRVHTSDYFQDKGLLKGASSKCKVRFPLEFLATLAIKAQARLKELIEAINHIKCDILGLSEIRRKGEEIIELEDHIFYYYGEDTKLCYDAVTEMSLLDMTLKEALRMFPPMGNLQRVCASKYTISQLGITLDPGVRVIIPIQAIQNDEQYFSSPSEFRPERFSEEEVVRRPKYAYLPFGAGPRGCIGARLGRVLSLAGLAAILQKFSVEPGAGTARRLRVNHRLNVVQGVVDGIPLRLKLRNKQK